VHGAEGVHFEFETRRCRGRWRRTIGSASLAEKRARKRRLGLYKKIVHEALENRSIDIASRNELARLASQNSRQKLRWSRKLDVDTVRKTSNSGIQLLESEDEEKNFLSD